MNQTHQVSNSNGDYTDPNMTAATRFDGADASIEKSKGNSIEATGNLTGFSHIGAPFKTKQLVEKSDSIASHEASREVIDIEAANIGYSQARQLRN